MKNEKKNNNKIYQRFHTDMLMFNVYQEYDKKK
jgi:hypothetical protein